MDSFTNSISHSTMAFGTVECDLLLVKLSIGKGSSLFIIMSEKQDVENTKRRENAT